MAIGNLSTLGPALTQRFAKKISRQYNREVVLSAEIGADAGDIGDAKNVAFDVVLGDLYTSGGVTAGQQASAFNEGTSMTAAEFSYDTIAPATLPWGQYRTGIAVTDLQLMAAMRSAGGGPNQTTSGLMEEKVLSAVTTLASLQNQDLWYGTGAATVGQYVGAPNIIGFLGGALAASGTYATINRANYPSFSGNILANGGVPRPLTFNLLSQLETNIFVASGQKPTKIVCSPNVWREYSNLFEPLRRFNDATNVYSTSTDVLMWRGIPVIRDKDGYEGGGAGTLLMINENHCKKKYLPFPEVVNSVDNAKSERQVNGEGSNGETRTSTGVPFRIVPLYRDGDFLRFMIESYVQLAVTRPNTNGALLDISITV